MKHRSRETGNIAGRALRDALVILGILVIGATVRVSIVPGGADGRVASPANLVVPAVRAMDTDRTALPRVAPPSASGGEADEYVTVIGLSG